MITIEPLKRKYFFKHLLASILITSLITLLCVLLWFPSPFLMLDGTWVALIIMTVIDIVIGPLLTLLLISSHKKKQELIIDMILILVIQISALSYGLLQITQERVFAMVHSGGVFHLVSNKEISQKKQDIDYSFKKYKNIYITMILDSDLLEHSKTSDVPLMYSPEKYKSIQKIEMMENLLPYESLPKELQTKYNTKYLYKILIGKKRNAIVIFNENMDIVTITLLPK